MNTSPRSIHQPQQLDVLLGVGLGSDHIIAVHWDCSIDLLSDWHSAIDSIVLVMRLLIIDFLVSLRISFTSLRL